MSYKVYIYALIDPETKEIRYIGRTSYLSQRKSTHKAEKTNKRKMEWIASLKQKGLEPEMIVLEECTNDNWAEAEIRHISLAQEKGIDLLNGMKGGGGGLVKEFKLINRLILNLDDEMFSYLKNSFNIKGFSNEVAYIRFLIAQEMRENKDLFDVKSFFKTDNLV